MLNNTVESISNFALQLPDHLRLENPIEVVAPQSASDYLHQRETTSKENNAYAEAISSRARFLIHHVDKMSPFLNDLLERLTKLRASEVTTFRQHTRELINIDLLDDLEVFISMMFQQNQNIRLKTLQELLNYLFYGPTTAGTTGTVFWGTETTQKEEMLYVSQHRKPNNEALLTIPAGSVIRQSHFIPLFNTELPHQLTNGLKYVGIVDFIESLKSITFQDLKPKFIRGYTNLEMGILATSLGFLIEELEISTRLPGRSLSETVQVVLTGDQANNFLRKTKHGRKIDGNIRFPIIYEDLFFNLTDKLHLDTMISIIQKTTDFEYVQLAKLRNHFHAAAKVDMQRNHPKGQTEDLDPELYSRAVMLQVFIDDMRDGKMQFGLPQQRA